MIGSDSALVPFRSVMDDLLGSGVYLAYYSCLELGARYQGGLLSRSSHSRHSRKTTYPGVPMTGPILVAADSRCLYAVVYVSILNRSKSKGQNVAFHHRLQTFLSLLSPLYIKSEDDRSGFILLVFFAKGANVSTK